MAVLHSRRSTALLLSCDGLVDRVETPVKEEGVIVWPVRRGAASLHQASAGKVRAGEETLYRRTTDRCNIRNSGSFRFGRYLK